MRVNIKKKLKNVCKREAMHHDQLYLLDTQQIPQTRLQLIHNTSFAALTRTHTHPSFLKEKYERNKGTQSWRKANRPLCNGHGRIVLTVVHFSPRSLHLFICDVSCVTTWGNLVFKVFQCLTGTNTSSWRKTERPQNTRPSF